MKAKIICALNYHGNTEFRCTKCGRHLSGMRLANYKKCPKCDKVFSNKVTIVRNK